MKKRGKNFLWTEEEKTYLSQNTHRSALELTEEMSRTKGAIEAKRSQWKMYYNNPPIYKRWESWEDELIEKLHIDNIRKNALNACLEALPHRTTWVIKCRIRMLIV